MLLVDIVLRRFLHNHALYRRRGSELGTMPYSYQMTPRDQHSTQYHRQSCKLQEFGQFGTLYMHNPYGTHPIRLLFEPSTSEIEPEPDRMSHRGGIQFRVVWSS